jgi:hypothetical protein
VERVTGTRTETALLLKTPTPLPAQGGPLGVSPGGGVPTHAFDLAGLNLNVPDPQAHRRLGDSDLTGDPIDRQAEVSKLPSSRMLFLQSRVLNWNEHTFA